MAVTLDATSSAFIANATSLTFSHTTAGADRGLLVFVGVDDTTTISSVTYAGTAMTLVRTDAVDQRTAIYKLSNPASGANDVVITIAALRAIVGAAQSYNNVHADVVSGHNGATGFIVTSLSVAVTSAAGEIVADILLSDVGNTDAEITPGAGQTQQWNNGAASNIPRANGSTEAGAASVTMSWTVTNNANLNLSAASVKEKAGVVSLVFNPHRMQPFLVR